MKFMRNFKRSFFHFFVLGVLASCNVGNNNIENQLNISDTSKAEVVVLDSLINKSLNVDTTRKSISLLESSDTGLTEDLLLKHSFDNVSKGNNKVVSHKDIIGKWLVEKRIGNGEEKLGKHSVFAEYKLDSSFFMSAINVSGKWWISDTLLFQQVESDSKVSVDTSIIHVLNDTVLEVLEMQRNYKFIFKKVSK